MVKERLASFICGALVACGKESVFLVDVRVKGTARISKVEVLVDTDTGISIATCLLVNRCLIDVFEESEDVKSLVGDDYELTVSSPGIGEPIMNVRQYIRHTGHLLRLQYTDQDNVMHEAVGRLLTAEVLGVAAPFIVLEPIIERKGKKGVHSEPVRLELSCIKRAVVEVEF
ncbi:ribosome maturation factor RimP [Prosthecochloris marina]|uniref:Ribosome maturation factor RimP n=1 Tax=Prosthecochloris marina TaxID=2017681 RepID=A0A317T7Q0_9CHLB|nr:ribosome maturation factor RimP [Prosthecochloris marina]